MRKYQYDDNYVVALDSNLFKEFEDYEDEEAYVRTLSRGRYQ